MFCYKQIVGLISAEGLVILLDDRVIFADNKVILAKDRLILTD